MCGIVGYIGDADVGADVNFSCGAIVVNYDGYKKTRSTIGDHAFVGCNVNLVSPVEIAPHAFVAAGSTITKNVPSDALAIARDRQRNIEGWVARKKGRAMPRGERAAREEAASKPGAASSAESGAKAGSTTTVKARAKTRTKTGAKAGMKAGARAETKAKTRAKAKTGAKAGPKKPAKATARKSRSKKRTEKRTKASGR